MVMINGKKFKINNDLKWGTQMMMMKIRENPENPKNIGYMEKVFRDLLIPAPTQKEMFNFRNSDIEKILDEFSRQTEKVTAESKKKLSIL